MGVTVNSTQPGTGVTPVAGDIVIIDYTGYLKDPNKPENDFKGDKFDSSVDRGRPFETKIGVGTVIKGWDEGVVQMQVGEKATLHITSDYGYGAGGFPGAIPPNADLIFDVHLKGVKGRDEPAEGGETEL